MNGTNAIPRVSFKPSTHEQFKTFCVKKSHVKIANAGFKRQRDSSGNEIIFSKQSKVAVFSDSEISDCVPDYSNEMFVEVGKIAEVDVNSVVNVIVKVVELEEVKEVKKIVKC